MEGHMNPAFVILLVLIGIIVLSLILTNIRIVPQARAFVSSGSESTKPHGMRDCT